MIMGLVYLTSYIIDPYILALRYNPYNSESMRIMSQVCTFIILLEILLIPLMGTKKKD